MTHIAKTIAAVATGTDPDVALIKDRAQPLTNELVDGVVARNQCHYAGRRPKVVTQTPTDMDLASYQLSLYRRKAVVVIDGYNRLTPRVAEDDVRHVGDVRFGQVIGLVSHAQYLSFGLRLQDASVVGNDGYIEQVGQARSFTLMAPNGDWHTGTDKLTWRQLADEAQFNQHYGLTLSDITTFVHRNRVQSVMCSPYLVAKCLLIRIEDQINHFSRQRASKSATVAVTRHQHVASEFVPSFTMNLEGFELVGEYAQDICTDAHLQQLYTWRQLVQWLVRINEYAFYLHGMRGGYTAPCVRGIAWQNTGAGQARLQLHPDLALTYRLRHVSRATVAQRVPLASNVPMPVFGTRRPPLQAQVL